MPEEATLLSWNAFQRANKGRGWSKQEMSECWAAFKRQQQHGHSKQGQRASQGVQSTLTALWLRSRGHRPASAAASDVACAADAAGAGEQPFSPMSPLTPSTCSSSCSTPVRLRPQPSPPAPSAAASAACTPPSAANPGTGWRFPPSEVSASPSPSPGPTLEDIVQLRAAVVHLLSASKARLGASDQQGPVSAPPHAAIPCGLAEEEPCKPHTPGVAAWVPPAAPGGPPAAAGACQPPLQQQQQQCTQPPPPPAASVGCFGSLTRRPPLSWNAFQRACAGRGLTKAEMSAAWKVYKSTGQLPAGDTAAAQLQQPAPGRWGSLKEWVSSRVNSRVSSRAASRAVSPTSSPVKQPAGLQRQQSAAQQQQREEAGGSGQQLSSDSDYLEQQQQLLELQLHEAQASAQQEQQWRWRTAGTSGSSTPGHAVVAAAAVAPDPRQGQQLEGGRLFHWGGSCVASVTGMAPGRRLREAVPDSDPALAGFGAWHPVRLHNLKLLKRAIPARPGLYEWGARLPVHSTAARDTAAATAAAEGMQAGEQAALGPVVCIYLGKAGSLRARLRAGRGEVLRTRFNKYALTKARRLGPAAEPHKDGLFEALQAAGRSCATGGGWLPGWSRETWSGACWSSSTTRQTCSTTASGGRSCCRRPPLPHPDGRNCLHQV